MNGDSNGTPNDDDPSESDTTIPVEVVSGDQEAAKSAEAEGGGEAPPGDELTQLRARVEALELEKKDSWDKLLRTAADLENLRKRQRRELEDCRHETKSRVLREMFPVADNLERALTVTAGDVEALLDGVRLVQRQFLQSLERLEVVPIEAEHQPFDPNLHEAISQQESEEHPPGTVIAVLQRGYKSGERLLRPSLVVVAKAKAG
ncbi:MAG: nucleotide exchange factor GrpE [Kofleriaceae bacterium]